MKIGIIGKGAVGTELSRLLENENPLIYDSKSSIDFSTLDVAFFCVSNEIAEKMIPLAKIAGCLCIDSSSAFRNTAPLVIPEINGHLLDANPQLIASPNCTTTLMLLVLAPLHKEFKIKKIVASTYQAVSGAGYRGIEELEEQTKAFFEKKHLEPDVFPHTCAFNVFPHESNGGEEKKMEQETKIILDDPTISMSFFCVRVPVFRVHSLALHVEFAKPLNQKQVETLLSSAKGIERKNHLSAIDAMGKNPVFFDRLELNPSHPNTIKIWVVGDQLLKGAALNMVQIWECLQKKTVSGGS